MTSKEKKDFLQMHTALKRIGMYQTPKQLRKDSSKDWGIDFEEAIEMAYENIQQEAKAGVKNIRIPVINLLTHDTANTTRYTRTSYR